MLTGKIAYGSAQCIGAALFGVGEGAEVCGGGEGIIQFFQFAAVGFGDGVSRCFKCAHVRFSLGLLRVVVDGGVAGEPSVTVVVVGDCGLRAVRVGLRDRDKTSCIVVVVVGVTLCA